MGRWTTIGTFLGLALVLVLFEYGWKKTDTVRPQETPLYAEEESPSNPPTTNNEPSPRHPNEDEPAVPAPDVVPPPSAADLRREVEAEPHEPPTALIEFADSLGGQMEEALQSEKAADELFGRLEDCVLGGPDRHTTSTRALCAANLNRLGERYPERFQEQVERVMGQVDESVRLILLALEST